MPREWKATVRPKTAGHHFPGVPPPDQNVLPYKPQRPTTAYVQAAQTNMNAKNEKALTLEGAKAKIRTLDINNPENWYRKRDYEFHLERVRTARPIVDTKSSMAQKTLYTSNAWYNKRQSQFQKITKENAMLLKRISDIAVKKELYLTAKPERYGATTGKELQRQNELIRITLENLTLMKRLQKPRASQYSRERHLKEFERNEERAQQMSKYPLFWNLRKTKGWEDHESRALLNALHNPRPLVFLTLHTKAKRFGRLVIELRADVCPMTCENFRALCTGEFGPSYRCTTMNRVVPGVLWQGGTGTGTGALNRIPSIFGKAFYDENFRLKHDGEGVVSMFNTGPNTNTAQFLITSKEMNCLDGKNVVFGKVVGGMGILNKMAKDIESNCGVFYKNSIRKIVVMNCGELAQGEKYKNDDLDNQDCYDENDFEDEIKKTSVSNSRETRKESDNDTGNEECSENENTYEYDTFEEEKEQEEGSGGNTSFSEDTDRETGNDSLED